MVGMEGMVLKEAYVVAQHKELSLFICKQC